MKSTSKTIRRKFPKRLRAVNCIDGCETDAPILSERKTINSAASIASGIPKVRSGALVSTPLGLRALI